MKKDKVSSVYPRTRHDYFYFLVALRYYRMVSRLLETVPENGYQSEFKEWREELSQSKVSGLDDKKIKEISEKYGVTEFTSTVFALRMYGQNVIVYSAMCLESLINDYCVIRKSKTFFNNYIDKLDTISKWKVVPELMTGNSIPEGHHSFELLKKLFKLRNRMVHPKSKEFDWSIKDPQYFATSYDELELKNIDDCIESIKIITNQLYLIDPEFVYLQSYKWLWDDKAYAHGISSIHGFVDSLWGKSTNEEES